jgi:hypothetical protein
MILKGPPENDLTGYDRGWAVRNLVDDELACWLLKIVEDQQTGPDGQ